MDIPIRKKTKVGTCIRDEKPSLIQVACALRGMLDDVIQGVGESPGIRNLLEYAAQNMIIEGVSSQEYDIERKVVQTEESITFCAHSCAHHANLMDISVWSGLPEEMQELVFAHLPWPQIYQVRILSKGWNQELMSGTKDSQLKRACARVQPKLFALLTSGNGPGSFTVNMFDIASNRWHTFETSLGYDPPYDEIQLVSASDGGWVCFLSEAQSTSENIPRLVFVCNPLTRVWKQLPPLYGIVQKRIMVQLIMDRETKHYRVIVVGYCKGPKVGNLVNVYHSETGQWTEADGSSSGEVVYGYLHKPKSDESKPAPSSYNFADGLVHKIVASLPNNHARKSVLLKDHLFCLEVLVPPDGFQTLCIEEYQSVHCGASCIPLKEYPLARLPRTPQQIQPDFTMRHTEFFASKDFLLLFVFKSLGVPTRPTFFFIYDFSAEEWREPPMMPGGSHSFISMELMCELRFDSVP